MNQTAPGGADSRVSPKGPALAVVTVTRAGADVRHSSPIFSLRGRSAKPVLLSDRAPCPRLEWAGLSTH